MQQAVLSRVVQDLIKALATVGPYTAVGTAGDDDGSITATVMATDPEGAQYSVEVRFSASR